MANVTIDVQVWRFSGDIILLVVISNLVSGDSLPVMRMSPLIQRPPTSHSTCHSMPQTGDFDCRDSPHGEDFGKGANILTTLLLPTNSLTPTEFIFNFHIAS